MPDDQLKARIIIPGVPKYPPCIFCGRPADSREHAWQQWLIKRLRKQIRSKVVIDTEFDHVRQRPRTSLFVKGIVCEHNCNNGWMRELENESIPVIEPLLLGEPQLLRSTAQLTLATWAVLRSVIFDCIKPSPRFYDSRETSHLLNYHAPPDSTFGVWLGQCSKALAFTDGKTLTRRAAGLLVNEGHVQTMLFGYLVFQVLTIRKPQSHPVASITVSVVRGPWNESLIQIWPLLLRPLEWPPERRFEPSADSLGALANRFNTGSGAAPLLPGHAALSG